MPYIGWRDRERACRSIAFAKRFANIAQREDVQKAGDARPCSQLGQCVFVKVRHFVDRKFGLASQQLDASGLIGFSTLRSEHGVGLGM